MPFLEIKCHFFYMGIFQFANFWQQVSLSQIFTATFTHIYKFVFILKDSKT